ncbi:MAG: FAD-dependent thymidylate synthase [Syntrophobacteraceae bacterium]
MTIQFVPMQVIPFGAAPSEEQRALRTVELCGRTAYKSEDKITDDSARAFVLMLKGHGHLSVLEHSNIVLSIHGSEAATAVPWVKSTEDFLSALLIALKDRHAYHRFFKDGSRPVTEFALSGNVRSWLETLHALHAVSAEYARFFAFHLNRFFPSLFDEPVAKPVYMPYDVRLMGEDEQVELLKKDPASDLPVFIFKFVCDRGITHEVVRHRVFSFTQESTRYVNYRSKGMTLILPEELEPFFDRAGETLQVDQPIARDWLTRAEQLFAWYEDDVRRGLKPQIARDILPNLLKSELFVTGRWSGWKHFITLRESSGAHPRVRWIARAVRQYFESMGLAA